MTWIITDVMPMPKVGSRWEHRCTGRIYTVEEVIEEDVYGGIVRSSSTEDGKGARFTHALDIWDELMVPAP